MHCTSCAFLIDGDLEDTPGIKKANTNYAKQISEVEFEDDEIGVLKIVETIKKTGYDAKLLE